MKILLTGVAGLIGAAVTERRLARGDEVLRLDNLNDYYVCRTRQRGPPGEVVRGHQKGQ